METSEKHTPSASQMYSPLGLGDNSNFPKCVKDMQKAKVTPIHQLDKINQLRSTWPTKENPKEAKGIGSVFW